MIVVDDRQEDIFRGHGIEVTLDDPQDFLKVKETLTRCGIPSVDQSRLTQTCHILHKRGRYRIMHFKELFLLDGKGGTTNLTGTDLMRRDRIVTCLRRWGLLRTAPGTVLNPASEDEVTIVPFEEKGNWELVSKYTVGEKRA